MTPIDIDAEWEIISGFLPPGWQELAWTTGAMRRHRGAIRDESTLLRMLLLYAADQLSFRSAVARAEKLGLARMSDEALMKRLGTSGAWLSALTLQMFTSMRRGRPAKTDCPGRLVRAVDATTVEPPGATQCHWRIHYSVGLSDLRCDFYGLTDSSGGETFKRFPVTPGDVLVGDRGYCHREAVADVKRRRADVVVRLNLTSFPLLGPRGAKFELLPQLRRMRRFDATEWDVAFDAYDKRHAARLCAVRKSAQVAEETKDKLRKEATGGRVSKDVLEAAEYAFVLTTIDEAELSAPGVLELYRARWQIELMFKRLKSLLDLDTLRQERPPGAKAWIEAKLLVALITERLLDEGRSFSPWGHDVAAPQPLAGVPRGQR
jgi:hypothetical protein